MKSRWKLPKSNGQACKRKLLLAVILALDAFKPSGGYQPTRKSFSLLYGSLMWFLNGGRGASYPPRLLTCGVARVGVGVDNSPVPLF